MEFPFTIYKIQIVNSIFKNIKFKFILDLKFKIGKICVSLIGF